MRKILAWIVIAPLAGVVLLFAVANRNWVTVSFDPFSADAPAYSAELPMFLLIFVALIAGIVIGGTAVWFGRLRWQMAAHRAEKEVARLRAEKAAAVRATPAYTAAPPMLPPH
jgi:uncharacterized integral membrane protein